MLSSVLGDSRILMSGATVVAVPGSMDATWETVVHPSAPKSVGLGRGLCGYGDVFFTFTSERPWAGGKWASGMAPPRKNWGERLLEWTQISLHLGLQE